MSSFGNKLYLLNTRYVHSETRTLPGDAQTPIVQLLTMTIYRLSPAIHINTNLRIINIEPHNILICRKVIYLSNVFYVIYYIFLLRNIKCVCLVNYEKLINGTITMLIKGVFKYLI